MTTAIRSEATRSVLVVNGVDRFVINADGSLETIGAAPADVFTQLNVLGTVSQAAGIPTGALIESGSNANGSYELYASGLQICTHRAASSTQLTTTTGSVFRTGSNAWTFPIEFIAEPTFTPHSDGSPGYSWGAIGAGVTTTTGATWSIFGPASSANNPEAHLIAIGRWF